MIRATKRHKPGRVGTQVVLCLFSFAVATTIAVQLAPGPASAASIINDANQNCRHFLFNRQLSRMIGQVPENFGRYDDCLKKEFDKSLRLAERPISDVTQLRREISNRGHVIRTRRTCVPSQSITQYRTQSLKRADRARRWLASVVTLRDMIVSEYRMDVSNAWQQGLLPGNLGDWLRMSENFNRRLGFDGQWTRKSFERVRLVVRDTNNLKAEIGRTIVQRSDCATAPSTTGGGCGWISANMYGGPSNQYVCSCQDSPNGRWYRAADGRCSHMRRPGQ